MEPKQATPEEMRAAMDKLKLTFADARKALRFHMATLEEWNRAGKPGTYPDFMERKLKAQPIRPLPLAVAIRRVNYGG